MPAAPSYFRLYNRTIRIIESPEGDVSGEALNLRTGFFDPASPEDVANVAAGSSDVDLAKLTEARFIRETEEARSTYLQGEGPVFDIYRRVGQLFDLAKSEGRWVTSVELDEIYSLWRRSFRLWEEEAARQEAGKPASFRYGRIGSL
ncbi:hypothetical protein ABIA39_003957 [Nocardia sp. GAS34]|uniref:hypothetical protein n=1 Tax=unclassified Nocardia TaxID=2637762 RepID=UPI003D1FBF5E